MTETFKRFDFKKNLNNDKKILIVDDSNTNLLTLELMLNNYKGNIDKAKNGAEALELFNQNRYDIIFMDCMMPVMNGYDATNAIRKIEEEAKKLNFIPIIAITGNIMPTEIEACYECGMNEYLAKPIRKTKLEDVINRYLKTEK